MTVVCIVAAACASTPQPVPEAVRVDGSTGVMPLVAALAREYRVTRPTATISLGPGLGTPARLTAVASGTIDIALASHGLVVTDIERQGLRVHKIADVPVVFAVNSTVPITDLTERQVCDVYSGAVSNWKQLGGPDLPIVAVTRPKGEVDGDVVTAGVRCFAATTLHAGVMSKEKPDEMATHLAETPGAIGMTTTTVASQSGGRVKALALGGVAPTPASVSAGRYRLTRQSFLVTRAEPSGAVQRFLAFIRSDAGARIISGSGAVPSR